MRTSKAAFAVTGTKEELIEFEKILKACGVDGVMSNESSRLLQLKWVVVYADFEQETKKDCKLTYAYRATNCKDTSKPSVISIKTAKSRLARKYYVRNGGYRR